MPDHRSIEQTTTRERPEHHQFPGHVPQGARRQDDDVLRGQTCHRGQHADGPPGAHTRPRFGAVGSTPPTIRPSRPKPASSTRLARLLRTSRSTSSWSPWPSASVHRPTASRCRSRRGAFDMAAGLGDERPLGTSATRHLSGSSGATKVWSNAAGAEFALRVEHSQSGQGRASTKNAKFLKRWMRCYGRDQVALDLGDRCASVPRADRGEQMYLALPPHGCCDEHLRVTRVSPAVVRCE